MKGKYLITTDSWFYASDSKQYKAVWGEIEIVEDSILGIKTNTRSSNWYAKVGSKDNHVIVAGCQIHYACRCEKEPETLSSEVNVVDGVRKTEERIHAIYIAK